MMSVLFGSARNRQSTTQHTLPMCYFLYAKMALFLQVVLIKVLLCIFLDLFAWVSGLEMYTLYLSKNGLKLVEYKKANVSWYVYTHESRLVLLASGMQCKTLSGFQVVYLPIIIDHV